MRINTAIRDEAAFTHEGARAHGHLTPEQALRRSVMSNLLWEDEFYEDGESIAARISENATKVSPAALARIAVEARTDFNLRHVPLLLLSKLAQVGSGSALVSNAIEQTIQRADELAEFLAVYAKVNGVAPNKLKGKISHQVRKGLARAFTKFDAYQLAKYDRAGAVRLRDALFLCHAKPKDAEQAALWKKLVAQELPTPDTWEVALSTGADKKETFERLLREGKLGYLALLRNLRNMVEAKVDRDLIAKSIAARKGADRVLPFRFIAAAKHCPDMESALDEALANSLANGVQLSGRTIIVVDISGSMGSVLSARSEMTRMDSACALAIILRGACEDVDIYATAGNDASCKHATAKVPARKGMALRDAIVDMRYKLGGGGIFLKPCLDFIREREENADRIVVLTDEQDCAVDQRDSPLLAAPFGRSNFLINVGSYKNGVGYGKWTHIDGFSEHTLRFIAESEKPLDMSGSAQ